MKFHDDPHAQNERKDDADDELINQHKTAFCDCFCEERGAVVEPNSLKTALNMINFFHVWSRGCLVVA